MVDMASIAAAVTGLKTATDIAKGLMELKTATEIQSKVIELQGVILSAQSSALAAQSDQFTLLETVRELKAKMADLEAWNTEKQRYHLQEVYAGAFAYVLKPEARGAEPQHWLCTTCYQRGIKSLLQEQGRDPRSNSFKFFKCTECGGQIRTFYRTGPSAEQANPSET